MDYIIEVATIAISIIALGSALIFNKHQIQHNKNSVRPYANFKFNHSDQVIYVILQNAGIGPMLINALKVYIDSVEIDKEKSVMSCVNTIISREQLKKYYDIDYKHIRNKSVLSPDSEFSIISLHERKDIKIKKDEEYYQTLAKLAFILRKISIELDFDDIYKTNFTEERKFSNHFGERYLEYLE